MQSPAFARATAIARRAPKSLDPSGKLQTTLEVDPWKWPAQIQTLSPHPDVFISALGSTAGAAGGLANQRKIDYDLNLELAKAALATGTCKVYVLVSTGMASSTSITPYLKMKGELEDAVKALDVPHIVLLQPGILLGPREETRPAEAVARAVAKGLSAISGGYLTRSWAQDVDVIARAAVTAARKCLDGQAPPGKVWYIGAPEIEKFGRAEWGLQANG